MAKNFRKAAQNSTSISPIMAGREKIGTDEIIGKTLTVQAFDIAEIKNYVNRNTGEVGDIEYGVYVFSEIPDKYYQAGTVGTRIINDWLLMYDGESEDVHDQCAELSVEVAAEKVQLKFTRSSTSRGQNIVKIDVI